MRYNLIILGLIFLFNPEINIIDILPDFIGVILVMKGILPILPLSPTIEDSYSSFKKYSLTSIIKTLAVLPLFSVASSDPAFYLLFTFAFALISLKDLLPAFNNLFSGIAYLKYHRANTNKNSKTLPIIFSVFFTLKYAFAVLPELVYLYIDDENVYDIALYPLAAYKGALVVICFTLALILGIIWLIIACGGFKKLKRDLQFNIAISKDISNIKHSISESVTTVFSKIYPLICLSAVFMIALYIDGVNFLPMLLSSILIHISIRNFRKIITVFSNKLLLSSRLSIIFSLISFITSITFKIKYHQIAAIMFKRVQLKFLFPCFVHLFASISFIFALTSLYKVLKTTLYEHTGNFWETPYLEHNSVAAKEKSRLQFKLKFGFLLGILLTVSNFMAYLLIYSVPIYSMINSAVGLAWVFYITSVYATMKNAIIEKYADEKIKN